MSGYGSYVRDGTVGNAGIDGGLSAVGGVNSGGINSGVVIVNNG